MSEKRPIDFPDVSYFETWKWWRETSFVEGDWQSFREL